MGLAGRVRELLPQRLVMTRLPGHARQLALTFDDGPDPQFTAPLLDLLEAHDARGTFFLIGRKTEKFPELAAEIAARGHELANHSWSHPRIGKLTRAQLREQIERTDTTLAAIDGNTQHYFRPPFGDLRPALLSHAWRQRRPVAQWSFDSHDYKMAGAQSIVDRLGQYPPQAGEVLLFHDDNQHTIDALARLLPDWAQRDLSMVTLSAATGRLQ